MKSNKTYSLLTIACVVFLVFLVVVTLAATVTEKRFFRKTREYTDFSTGWLSEDNKEVSLEKITENCRLHKVIPPMESHMTLIMNVRDLNVDVYIDDECVYRYTEPDNSFLTTLYGKTAGSDFVDVKITKESAGKTIYIDATCPYKNGWSSKIVNMYFGNSTEIVKHCTAIQLNSFSFGIMLLLIGAVCLLLCFPLMLHHVVNKSMFYLGLLSCIFGLLMITDSKLIQLVVGHETLFFTASHMFMTIIPTPMLLFFAELYGDLNKKIVSALCILNLTDCVAIFILNALGIVDYHENVVLVSLLFVVCLFYIGFATIRRMIKEKGKNLFHNIGVIIVGVSILINTIMIRIKPGTGSSSIMVIGFVAFSCLECIQVTTVIIGMNKKSLREEIVSRLAYHDGLTDLLNRTSFQEDIEELEKKPPQNTLAAIFDINDLKYVNDNFGHGSGDDLITTIANAIEQSFRQIGKCYRIGGDEFVLISIVEDSERKYTESKAKMDKIIDEANRLKDFPVSVAVGYSTMNGRGLTMKELLDEADNKMYEVKRKMKAQGHKMKVSGKGA